MTGATLKEIALHAIDMPGGAFEEIAKSVKVCVIPLTCGHGAIPCFGETVSSIINHLGFSSFVARHADVMGIAEAFKENSDILFLADDDSFVAIHVDTRRISDNSEMTANGFVAGLDLMVGGLKGQNVLVIGCGRVGCHAARRLAAMGVRVAVSDVNPLRSAALQQEIMDELKTRIRIDRDWYSTPGKYPYIVDATPSTDVIRASMVTPDTYIAAPGVPCGLSSEVKRAVSNRYLHDPLQIGVAAMVMDACKPLYTREHYGLR